MADNHYSDVLISGASCVACLSQEHEALVRDRVEILAAKIDADGSGTLDQDEICAAVRVLYGITVEEAQEEAKNICANENMSVEQFVDSFTELAESNLDKFAEVEKAYGIA